MLSVLATSSSSTTPRSTTGGKAPLMLAARPLPVTRPMRAHIDCIAAISGKAERHRPQHVEAELRAGLRIGRDAARIVVGDAGDEPGADPRERMFLQPGEIRRLDFEQGVGFTRARGRTIVRLR